MLKLIKLIVYNFGLFIFALSNNKKIEIMLQVKNLKKGDVIVDKAHDNDLLEIISMNKVTNTARTLSICSGDEWYLNLDLVLDTAYYDVVKLFGSEPYNKRATLTIKPNHQVEYSVKIFCNDTNATLKAGNFANEAAAMEFIKAEGC